MRIRAPFLRCSPIRLTVLASTPFAWLSESPCASPIDAASWRSVTSSIFAGFAGTLAAVGAFAAVTGLDEVVVLAVAADLVFVMEVSPLHYCRFSLSANRLSLIRFRIASPRAAVFQRYADSGQIPNTRQGAISSS